MTLLKMATAYTEKIGPFVDATDGVTVLPSLTIKKANTLLSKNGGALTATHSNQGSGDAGMAYDANGFYAMSLDTTDTGALDGNGFGYTIVASVNMTGALPVWKEFYVAPLAVYDALTGGPNGYLPADVAAVMTDAAAATNMVVLFGGVATAMTNLRAAYDGATGFSGSGQTAKPQVDLKQILGTSLPAESAGGRDAAAFGKFFDKSSPTGTINSLPDAVPGANNGLPTTDGTKLKQTVDLTAAAIQAIWDALTAALTTTGSIGKKLADWVLGTDSKVLLSANAQTGTDLALIKAKTDLIPASPAAVDSAMVLTADYDAAKTAATQASVNTLDAVTDIIAEEVGQGGTASFTEQILDNVTSEPVPYAETWINADNDGQDVGVPLQTKEANAAGWVTYNDAPGWYWLHAKLDAAFNVNSVRKEARL